MNQADKDAAKWMEANAKWQYRDLVIAKETGCLHHINQHGDVVIETKEDQNANK